LCRVVRAVGVGGELSSCPVGLKIAYPVAHDEGISGPLGKPALEPDLTDQSLLG
jgi:hypothetical protein